MIVCFERFSVDTTHISCRKTEQLERKEGGSQVSNGEREYLESRQSRIKERKGMCIVVCKRR